MASDPALAVQALTSRVEHLRATASTRAPFEQRRAVVSLLAFAHQVAAGAPAITTAARRAMLRQWLLAADISLRDNDLPAALAAIGRAAMTCRVALAVKPRLSKPGSDARVVPL